MTNESHEISYTITKPTLLNMGKGIAGSKKLYEALFDKHKDNKEYMNIYGYKEQHPKYEFSQKFITLWEEGIKELKKNLREKAKQKVENSKKSIADVFCSDINTTGLPSDIIHNTHEIALRLFAKNPHLDLYNRARNAYQAYVYEYRNIKNTPHAKDFIQKLTYELCSSFIANEKIYEQYKNNYSGLLEFIGCTDIKPEHIKKISLYQGFLHIHVHRDNIPGDTIGFKNHGYTELGEDYGDQDGVVCYFVADTYDTKTITHETMHCLQHFIKPFLPENTIDSHLHDEIIAQCVNCFHVSRENILHLAILGKEQIKNKKYDNIIKKFTTHYLPKYIDYYHKESIAILDIRTKRTKRLEEINAPEAILINEYRMKKEAEDRVASIVSGKVLVDYTEKVKVSVLIGLGYLEQGSTIREKISTLMLTPLNKWNTLVEKEELISNT